MIDKTTNGSHTSRTSADAYVCLQRRPAKQILSKIVISTFIVNAGQQSTMSTCLLLSNRLIGVTQINIPFRHSVVSVLAQCVLPSKDDQSLFEFLKKQ